MAGKNVEWLIDFEIQTKKLISIPDCKGINIKRYNFVTESRVHTLCHACNKQQP